MYSITCSPNQPDFIDGNTDLGVRISYAIDPRK